MKLELFKIRAKNFLSVGAVPIEIEFSPGNHVVIGENGAGKTTLFIDAVLFAIKGTSIRKVNKEGMINSINQKECEVVLWFKLNNVKYRIERGLKPNYLRFINEDEKEEVKEKSGLYNTQSDIDSKFAISDTSLINMVTLNIRYSKPFFQLTAAERREIMLDVSNISIFGKMLEQARKDYNNAKNDLKVLTIELTGAEENYSTKLNNFKKLKDMKDNFDVIKNKEISQLTTSIDEYKLNLEGLNSQLPKKNFKELLEKFNESKQKLQNLVYESTSKINSNTRNIQAIKNKIEKLLTSPHCTECNSPTSNEHALIHIANLQKEIKDLEDDNVAANQKLDKMKIKSKELKETGLKIDEQYEKQTAILAKINNVKEKIKNFEVLLEKAKVKEMDFDEVEESKDLEKALKRVTIKKEEVKNKEKELKLTDIARDRLGDKGIKSFSIKAIIPILNKTMNEFLSIFNATYTISFDEELNETLKSRRRDVFMYNNFSAGEQKRIDLALMFSLLKISKKKSSVDCNILVLDEILDSSIESKGTHNLISFIKTTLKTHFPGLCLYVISHRSEIGEDNFDTVIKIKKDGDFTKIDEVIKCDPTIQV